MKTIYYLVFIFLISCIIEDDDIPEELDINLGVQNVGMISGKLYSPDIIDNQIVYNTNYTSDVKVVISGTEFKTRTSFDGSFSFVDIPAGTYDIIIKEKNPSFYGDFYIERSIHSVTVYPQKISEINIETVLLSNQLIIHGKVYEKDKVTLVSNKVITAFTPAIMNGEIVPGKYLSEVITSYDGSYGFITNSGNRDFTFTISLKWCKKVLNLENGKQVFLVVSKGEITEVDLYRSTLYY